MDEDDLKSDGKVSKYGQDLFGFFCNNQQAQAIFIRDFVTLPKKLRSLLFQNEKGKFSLNPFFILFASMKEIKLNDLNIKSMIKVYVKKAIKLIQSIKSNQKNLNRIVLRSKAQTASARNSLLSDTINQIKSKKFESNSSQK